MKLVKLHTRKEIERSFLETFEIIGGLPRLARWANEEENYATFLKMLLVFAPKEASHIEGQVLEYRSNVPQSPLNRLDSN